VAKINDWDLYYYILFEKLLYDLVENVEAIKKKTPIDYSKHPNFKLLESIYFCITKDIPTDPTSSRFQIGNTLGKDYKNWRRAKQHLPPRYRLFFFFSSSKKKIIYSWFNNVKCLRKDGSKTDVYEVFKKLLSNTTIPNEFDKLLNDSRYLDIES